MRSILGKRYPLIGARGVIPTADVMSCTTGVVIDPAEMTEIDIAEGMEVVNVRTKLFVYFVNDDPVADLVVTPIVTGKIYTYDVESPEITIPAAQSAMIGPFSANFETTSKVAFDFTGVSGLCQAIRLP